MYVQNKKQMFIITHCPFPSTGSFICTKKLNALLSRVVINFLKVNKNEKKTTKKFIPEI